MKKVSSVTVGIKTDISESTANLCLRLLEVYLNNNPSMVVIPCEYANGEVCLELVDSEEVDLDEIYDQLFEDSDDEDDKD